jgi:predicted branched-subunit amino acid permease
MTEQAKIFWAGVRSEIPLLIGVFPFGMIYGALAINAGLSASDDVFAGIRWVGAIYHH